MIGDGKYQQSEFTRETFYRMEHENIFLKAQRDELLEAAKAFFQIWDDDAAGLDAVSEAVEQLKAAIAKSEGRAS